MIDFWCWIVVFSSKYATRLFVGTIVFLLLEFSFGVIGTLFFGITIQQLLNDFSKIPQENNIDFLPDFIIDVIPSGLLNISAATGIMFALAALSHLFAVYCTARLGEAVELKSRALVLSGSRGIPAALERVRTQKTLAETVVRNSIKSRGVGRCAKAATKLIPDIFRITVLTVLLFQIGTLIALVCFSAFALGFVVNILQNRRIKADETSLLSSNAEMKRAVKRGAQKLNFSQPDFQQAWESSRRSAHLFHKRAVVIAQANTVLTVFGFLVIIALVALVFLDENGQLTNITALILSVVLFRMLYSTVQAVSAGVGVLYRMRFHIRPVIDYLRGTITVAQWQKSPSALPVQTRLCSAISFNEISKDVFAKAIEYSTGQKPGALACDTGNHLSFALDGTVHTWTLAIFETLEAAVENCEPRDLLLANNLPYAIGRKGEVNLQPEAASSDESVQFDEDEDDDNAM